MVTDTHADTLTHMQHNDPAQYTVLGWVKIDRHPYRQTNQKSDIKDPLSSCEDAWQG